LLKENSDLGTQRGRLEYHLKQPVGDDMLVHLSGLGKFHKGDDTLADIVPERNGMYALHPDKWESTFYSLTNKDAKKIVHYKPTLIKAPSDMIIADMAIANKYYRTDSSEEQDKLAKEYKDSIGNDVSSMKMPEVIMSTPVNEGEDFVTLKKDDKIVRVPRSRLEFYLGQHYELVEGITEAVHTFMTGHGVTFAGKKYDKIEIEVTGVDNASRKYNIMILSPKELFGKTVTVSSKYMERGPWTKTETPDAFAGEKDAH
jgi:hypothetical protein